MDNPNAKPELLTQASPILGYGFNHHAGESTGSPDDWWRPFHHQHRARSPRGFTPRKKCLHDHEPDQHQRCWSFQAPGIPRNNDSDIYI